jgi:hypothetical protein
VESLNIPAQAGVVDGNENQGRGAHGRRRRGELRRA